MNKNWLWLLGFVILAGLILVIADGQRYRGSTYKAEPRPTDYKKSTQSKSINESNKVDIDSDLDKINEILESLDNDNLSDDQLSNESLEI